jgi:hypothetical protein
MGRISTQPAARHFRAAVQRAQHPPEETCHLHPVRVLRLGQIDLSRHHAIRLEAGIDGEELQETAHEQTGADQ